MNDYEAFVAAKLGIVPPTGLTHWLELGIDFMPHQDVLTKWALKRGRAAIFADTGLGKARMGLGWSKAIHDHTRSPVIVLTPLAVARQMAEEGEKIGIEVNVCRDDSDVRNGINVINYDRLHRIDPERFIGVLMDESGCIKNHTSKTLDSLLQAFQYTPYKLCETATPAPNDWTELGTHAEFLGICTRAEMLAEYFVHDGAETQVWRLKGHARKQFWRWVASWGAMIRKPSDLGFDDSAYILPPLNVQEHTVQSCIDRANDMGFLFPVEAGQLSERRDARRHSITDRVNVAAQLANNSRESWVIWCDLNAEGDALRAAIPDAVEIRGSDDPDDKEQRLYDFAHGKIRVLVSKPSITGYGLNWQHCCNTAFVGVTDSFEAYYQAVRRFWRFGQTKQVNVHIIASEAEGSVIANLKRKEADALAMAEALSAETREAVMAEVRGSVRRSNPYLANQTIKAPSWLQTESI